VPPRRHGRGLWRRSLISNGKTQGCRRLTRRACAISTASTNFMGVKAVSDPDDPSDGARLKALEDRIAKAKAAVEPTPHMKKDYSQAQLAWRMVIELVAGLLIGLGIGYGLDYLLGTMPLFLVLFIGFGLAAGVKTMMRSAQEVQERRLTQEAAEKRDD